MLRTVWIKMWSPIGWYHPPSISILFHTTEQSIIVCRENSSATSTWMWSTTMNYSHPGGKLDGRRMTACLMPGSSQILRSQGRSLTWTCSLGNRWVKWMFSIWISAHRIRIWTLINPSCFSRYPTWRSDRQPLDVRPPSLIRDDSVYIDDDDICIIKTEECERRNVYVKSTTPFLGPTPLASIVISDSDNSDSGFDFTDYPSIPIRGK